MFATIVNLSLKLERTAWHDHLYS